MKQIIDITCSVEGTPYAVTADGELYQRVPCSDMMYAGLPPAKRPKHEWKRIECPYGITRVMAATQGELFAICLNVLFQRVRDPEYIGPQVAKWDWVEVNLENRHG